MCPTLCAERVQWQFCNVGTRPACKCGRGSGTVQDTSATPETHPLNFRPPRDIRRY